MLSPAGLAARDAVLRCWVRERGIAVPAAGTLATDEIEAEVEYRSATGHHRFSSVRIGQSEVDAATLAAALVGSSAGAADLTGRVADSARRIDRYVSTRRGTPGAGFLEAEQALLVGHQLHPAAKSRDGLTDVEDDRYAPELRGRFRLHWFAVSPTVLRAGGTGTAELLTRLSEVDGAGPVVPAHPWQAADLVHRPEFRPLLESGAVRPLGESGPEWYPTSSLRTVYRPDAPVMLKLSLGLRITNSKRENTLTELARGIEVCRLLDSGIDSAVRTAYPAFRIVRDPGYLAVVLPDSVPSHLDVSVREVPNGLDAARCLAGLVAPQPGIGPSLLVSTVDAIAARSGRPVTEVAAEWCRRYVVKVLGPMILLYASSGIGLEAHQQNTLVVLDDDGWPATGWYRDNQGYYLAESGLPGVLRRTGAGSSTLALAPDSIVDDRLTYYLLLNQALAPVAALGAVAAEPILLGAVRSGLAELVAAGHDTPRGLVRRWLDAETLPCKANLATRLAGIDEVLAPVDNQSVYIRVPNPLRETA